MKRERDALAKENRTLRAVLCEGKVEREAVRKEMQELHKKIQDLDVREEPKKGERRRWKEEHWSTQVKFLANQLYGTVFLHDTCTSALTSESVQRFCFVVPYSLRKVNRQISQLPRLHPNRY